MNSTVRRLLLGAAYTIGGIGLALAADSAAHATDKPPAVEVESPGGAVDLPADIVDVVKPEEPPPCDEPAAAEPEPKPREDGEPKPDKPADEPKPRDEEPETPAEPEPEPETPAEPPVDDKPKPHKPDPIVELPPVEVPPVVVPPAPEPVVAIPAPVVIDVPPAPAPTVPPAPAPVVTPEPAPSTPAPPVDHVHSPPAPDDSPPAKPTPAPAKPAPLPAVPLPVTIGPVPATGITLDGTTTIAVDDVPAAAAVLEVPLCGDEQPTPARDYPRGHVRRILDTTTGLTVTTVPADPPAKPCPTKPQGPDATSGVSPTMKPGPPGIDLAVPSGSKLHRPTPALLHHIWPRASIPATRGEHIEPRPA